MVSQITRISSLLIFFIASTITIFGQCDEYYINELISGSDEQCYFPQGSPVRFCPRLKGIAINGTSFDVMQWDGISTQYLTLTKNGGIAGTLVLKLNQKELLVNLNGCGGARTYSLSLNKTELQDFYKRKDAKLIEEINLLFSNQQYEQAFELTSKLKDKNNFGQLNELEKLCNDKRLLNYQNLMSKSNDEIKNGNFLIAANLFSEIILPTNLEWNERSDYTNLKSSIESSLKKLYADSAVILNDNFKFSNSNDQIQVDDKNIAFNQAIFSHIDSLPDGDYYLRIIQIPDRMAQLYPDMAEKYPPSLTYDIGAKKFGIKFNFENGSLWLETTPGGPVSKLGLPAKMKVNSIDGILFTNSEDPLRYVQDKDMITISYWDSILNINKEQKLMRGYQKYISLPGDQKKCTRWMQGGYCVDYYTYNLLDEWSTDSIKNINIGVFSITAPNLIPFKLERKQVNPIFEYYTKTGETLKVCNDNYYRKAKGKQCIKQETILYDKLSENQVVKSKVGPCNFLINNKENYTMSKYRRNTYFPIFDQMPKGN